MKRRISAERVKELKELASRPDCEIDSSDIPEMTELPLHAVVGKFYRPQKPSPIRLDAQKGSK